MIIVKISHGLGNQLFQYALGRYLSIKNKTDLFLDTSFYTTINKSETPRTYSLDNFKIIGKLSSAAEMLNIGIPNVSNTTFVEKLKRKLLRMSERTKPLRDRKFIIEPYFQFCPEIFEINDNCYLSGNWQSEKYFKKIEDVLRKELTLKNIPTFLTKEWLQKTATCNSISIHIRRGDYIQKTNTNKIHGTCEAEYYENAVKLISKTINKPEFFIFSDDIDWAKKNLRINYPIHLVSDNEILDYEELIIMSNCKHNITANSSFSWWGAWLNNNRNKITIAPKKWFQVEEIDTKDLIPSSWIRI
ncbi:MAG: alpha-1,2-fucosyltransferase [Candidatus Vogelbacteria bacterium]|nr:alpha-1,2-fucosyltransferase [Candidatus Vogelbacteria bacterium]